MNKRFEVIIIFLIISFLILPGKIFAYYESPGPSDLRAVVFPVSPRPGDRITINLNSYLLQLDACSFSWRKAGTEATQGVGKKTYTFSAGELGQVIPISAIIDCADRQSIKKDFVFQSNAVDFLTAPNTYTPPFYKGNTRATPGSQVRIIAVPRVFDGEGKEMNPENLIYRWTKEGKAMPQSSGYGKSTVLITTDPLPGTATLGVEISTLEGETKTSGSINVRTANPQILIYESKPLVGIQSQKSLAGTLTLSQEEMTLIAEPFFFPNQTITSNRIAFGWSMNGKSITPNSDGRSVTLRQEKGKTGEALISLKTSDLSNVFSSIQKTLNIKFGGESSIFDF